MEFEKILQERVHQEIIEGIQKDFERRYYCDIEEETLKENKIASIANAHAIYIVRSRPELSKEQEYKLYDEFDQETTPEALMKLRQKIELEQAEREYIEYMEHIGYRGGEEAVIQVLMRRVLLEKLREEPSKILLVLQQEANENERFAKQYSYLAKLISGELFEVHELLKRRIEEDSQIRFNQSINCGGYALKIDTGVFPSKGDFEAKVSSILESFPFVRLLGDTKLQEDEYLVLYRAKEDGGHHFIRIEDDGTVMEKDGADPIQQFKDWKTLKDAPEAVFAVKKEHEMNYFKLRGSIIIPTKDAKNFEKTVWSAMQNRQNTFEYHNHTYSLKKAGEETVYICSGDEIVAEMMTDGEEYDIEIRKGKRAFISNTQPKNPIVIKDGKYQCNGQQEVSR